MANTLVSALNMAKSRRMKFLLVAKGNEDSRLLMSPNKVKGEDVKVAITETKGKVVARGDCYRTGKLMIFECVAKPPTTLRNLLMKSIKAEAKMSMLVQARHADEVASEQEQLAKSRAELVDRIKRISDLMKGLKGKVEGAEWAGWNDIRTNAVKEAKETGGNELSKVLGQLDDLEKDLEVAALETAEDSEAAEKMLSRQKEAGKLMQVLQGRIDAPAWKGLQAQNTALSKAIEKKEWEKANQQLRELLKAITAAEKAAGEDDGLDLSGDNMRKLFPDKEDKEEADAKERDRWKKQIQLLAGRAEKLAGPESVRLRNLVAGLFQMLKSKDWEDVEESVDDAVEQITAAEKAEQAENEKQRTKYTAIIKELAKQTRKLKDAKGNDFSKRLADLTALLQKKDWKALEKQVPEVEKEVEAAENRLSEDDQQRIALTATIKKLAERATKLTAPTDVPVRNRIAGLFPLLKSGDLEDLGASIVEATKLVEDAEKRMKSPPR